MKARRYEVAICTGCGVVPRDCRCEGGITGKIVTATDDRDVQPLVEAARSGASALKQSAIGIAKGKAAAPQYVQMLEQSCSGLLAALQPFEEESG